MIILRSKRLHVALPSSGERPNTTFRFDRAGFIANVILDGSVYFGASEPQNLSHPSSGGRGLCSEFKFDACAEAAEGEYFPKFGIGLIRKEPGDVRYSYTQKYKDVQLYPITVEHTESSATFVTEAIPCLGYAFRSTKTITVEDTTITETIKIENVGEKTVSGTEYCHNFISIDGMAIGPDYTIEMPAIAEQKPERLEGVHGGATSLVGKGKGFTFAEFNPRTTLVTVNSEGMDTTIPFTWKITNAGAKAYVEAAEYFVPHKVDIWAVDHMVCPEIHNWFEIAPGETQEWKRSWTFGKLYE